MKGCCVASRRIILLLTVSAMMAATALPALTHTDDVTHTGDLIKGGKFKGQGSWTPAPGTEAALR